MPILPIHLIGQPVLRRKTERIESITPEVRQLIQDMIMTMGNAEGIGLAAPQVGHPIRLFVVDISPLIEDLIPEEHETLPEQPMVFINPEIIWESDDEDEFEEGCLSIPEIKEYVKRPASIEITYQDQSFSQQTITVDSLLARVIQHEYDHIEGTLFIDHISAFRRSLLKRRLSEIARNNVEANYPVYSA